MKTLKNLPVAVLCVLVLAVSVALAGCGSVDKAAKDLLNEINNEIMPEYVETTDTAFKKNPDGSFAEMFDADQKARRKRTAERIDKAVKALDPGSGKPK